MISPFEIHHPARLTIAGTSGTGKTMWVLNLIRYRTKIFKPFAPTVIYFHYEHEQEWFPEFANDVIFVKELPRIWDITKATLIISDDSLLSKASMQQLATLYIGQARHSNATCIFLTQSLFYKDPNLRLVTSNTTIFVIFKMIRAVYQVERLLSQIFSRAKSKIALEVYHDALKTDKWSYLMVDLQLALLESPVLRSNVFPPAQNEFIYKLA